MYPSLKLLYITIKAPNTSLLAVAYYDESENDGDRSYGVVISGGMKRTSQLSWCIGGGGGGLPEDSPRVPVSPSTPDFHPGMSLQGGEDRAAHLLESVSSQVLRGLWPGSRGRQPGPSHPTCRAPRPATDDESRELVISSLSVAWSLGSAVGW